MTNTVVQPQSCWGSSTMYHKMEAALSTLPNSHWIFIFVLEYSAWLFVSTWGTWLFVSTEVHGYFLIAARPRDFHPRPLFSLQYSVDMLCVCVSHPSHRPKCWTAFNVTYTSITVETVTRDEWLDILLVYCQGEQVTLYTGVCISVSRQPIYYRCTDIVCVCSCFACTGCPVVALLLTSPRSKLTRELVDREADLGTGLTLGQPERWT